MDITRLTPEELGALKAQLDSLTDTSGRSPMKPRQLHDLRLTPTAQDPRPTFFWSAESPRNAIDLTRTTPYPRLMWDAATGVEVTVTSASDEQTHADQGFVVKAPGNAEQPDEREQLRLALAALSPEDRALIAKAQKADRLEALKSALLELPEEEAQALLDGVRRGPGRPRKES